MARFKTTYLATKPRESRPRLEKRTLDLKTNVRLLVGFEAQLVFTLQLFLCLDFFTVQTFKEPNATIFEQSMGPGTK